MRVRGEDHTTGEDRAPEGRGQRRALGLDGIVVPALLLLVARDLLLHDPIRVLAWRLAHDPKLAHLPAWIAPLLPRLTPSVDRDPVALLLGAVASILGVAYLFAALLGASARFRAIVLGLAAVALVLLPSAGLIALGVATDRPYGQDGGVVQMPLALEKILAGGSPYGADYSDSILGKQARVSSFWDQHGGNPILRHHAYLPGTHLLMLPFYLAGKSSLGFFDTRLVTLLAWALAGFFASRLFPDPSRRLTGAAAVLVNPLIYWHQIFGANDLILVALILGAVLLLRAGSLTLGAAVLGLACATKQLAWPFAPFLLVSAVGVASPRSLLHPPNLRRAARIVGAFLITFVSVVAPLALRDPGAFWGDIVVYNVGLPGADNYPLGGTPGFGFANFLIAFGLVSSLREYVPFGIFYVVLVPLGVLLLVRQTKAPLVWALASGSAALLLSVYFSRVVHPNYVILAAALLPLAGLARTVAADLVVAPLLLLGVAVEVAEAEVFRILWEEAPVVGAALGPLAPRAGSDLTRDPLGLLVSAAVAGLAVGWLVAGTLGAGARVRRGLLVTGVLVAVLVPTSLAALAGREAAPSRPVRAQDPWVAELGPQPEVREAWSSSHRKEPPALLEPSGLVPGRRAVGWLLRRSGLHDPRWLTVAAAVFLAGVVLAGRSGEREVAAWVGLLTPAAAVGAAFGAPDLVGLAVLVAAWWLTRVGYAVASGVVLGVGLGVWPVLVFAAPFLLLGSRIDKGKAHGRVAGCALGFGLMLAARPTDLAALVDGAFRVGPGLGVVNVLLYGGAEAGTPSWLLVGLGLVTFLGAVLAARGRTTCSPAWAAAYLGLGLVIAPQLAPVGLALPVALLGLQGLWEGGVAAPVARGEPEVGPEV